MSNYENDRCWGGVTAEIDNPSGGISLYETKRHYFANGFKRPALCGWSPKKYTADSLGGELDACRRCINSIDAGTLEKNYRSIFD